MNKKLLAVDLDGTLFYPKRRFTLTTSSNSRFLRAFLSEGNEVVIATGRNAKILPKIERKLGSPLTLLGCNGAFALRQGAFIDAHPLPNKVAADIFLRARERFGIQVWALMDDTDKDYLYFNESMSRFAPLLLKMYYFFSVQYREITVIRKEAFLRKLQQGQIFKLSPVFGKGREGRRKASLALEPMRRAFGESCELVASDAAVEITALGTSKGKALADYAQKNGYSLDDVLCVGDTGNDVSMFRRFPHSFAMSHASKWVRDEAAHRVDRVSDIEGFLKRPASMEGDLQRFLRRREDSFKPRG